MPQMDRKLAILDCRDRLAVAVRAAQEAIDQDSKVEVSLTRLIALARKVTPSTRPPPGLLFSVESGPAEALPIRFRLPYPTLDEMKMSMVATEGNKYNADQTETTQLPRMATSNAMIVDDASDDYEDDF